MKNTALILFVLFGSSAIAAEYKFYFNNTEQGDNSTATPNMSVSSAPVNAEKNSDEPQSSAQSDSDQKKLQESDKKSSLVSKVQNGDEKLKRLRLAIGAFQTTSVHNTTDTGRYTNQPSDIQNSNSGRNPFLKGSFFINESVGVGAFYSSYQRDSYSGGTWGAEIEFNPIAFNAFTKPRAIEIGLLGGWWNLARLELVSVKNRQVGDHPDFRYRKGGTVFGGPRIAVNIPAGNNKYYAALEGRMNAHYTAWTLSAGMQF